MTETKNPFGFKDSVAYWHGRACCSSPSRKVLLINGLYAVHKFALVKEAQVSQIFAESSIMAKKVLQHWSQCERSECGLNSCFRKPRERDEKSFLQRNVAEWDGHEWGHDTEAEADDEDKNAHADRGRIELVNLKKLLKRYCLIWTILFGGFTPISIIPV